MPRLVLLSLFLRRFRSNFQGVYKNEIPYVLIARILSDSRFLIKIVPEFHKGSKNAQQSALQWLRSSCAGEALELIPLYHNRNTSFYSYYHPENLSEIAQEIKAGDLIL